MHIARYFRRISTIYFPDTVFDVMECRLEWVPELPRPTAIAACLSNDDGIEIVTRNREFVTATLVFIDFSTKSIGCVSQIGNPACGQRGPHRKKESPAPGWRRRL